MKKILIYAYTALNLGDDLFVKVLCNRYPDTKFYIVCNKKFSVPFKIIKNLTIIPSIPKIDSVFRILKIKISVNDVLHSMLSRYCDAVVHIGGSIFIQKENWVKKAVLYRNKISRSKKFFILGSNFGPYEDINFAETYKQIFATATDVCFRDRYSYSLFSDLSNVRYESDIVFNLTTPKTNITKDQIVISVIDLSWREKLKEYETEYIIKLAQLASCFAKNNYTVYLMGFCNKEGDNKAIGNICTIIDEDVKKNIHIYNYMGNIDEAIILMNQSKYIITARFHAMILGWVLGIPVHPILYSDKSLHVIEDIGFDGKYSKIEDINANEIFENIIKSQPFNVEQQKTSANLQFKKLDDFLK